MLCTDRSDDFFNRFHGQIEFAQIYKTPSIDLLLSTDFVTRSQVTYVEFSIQSIHALPISLVAVDLELEQG